MKKVFILILLCFTLSGCITNNELRNRGIIQVIGVDKIGDDYVLTIDLFSQKISKGGESGIEDQSIILNAKGKTISQAIFNAGIKNGTAMFLGNTKTIIVGKETGEKGIQEIIDYFNADFQIKIKTKIIICETTAQEFLTTKGKNEETIKAKKLNDIVQNAEKQGLIGNSDIQIIENSFNNNAKNGFLLGYIKIKNDISMTAEIDGNAVFYGDKLIDIIDRDLSVANAFLNNDLAYNIYTLKINEDDITLICKKIKSKIKTEVENDILNINAEINLFGNITEMHSDMSKSNDEKLSELENKVAEDIKKRMEILFQKCINDNGVDAFNLTDITSKGNFDFVYKNRDNWNEIMKKSKFNVLVKCNIERTAMIGEKN